MGAQPSAASGEPSKPGQCADDLGDWLLPASCRQCQCSDGVPGEYIVTQPWFSDSGDDDLSWSDPALVREKLKAGSAIQGNHRLFVYPPGAAALRLRGSGFPLSMRALPQAAADLLIYKGAQEEYASFSSTLSTAPVLPRVAGGGLDP